MSIQKIIEKKNTILNKNKTQTGLTKLIKQIKIQANLKKKSNSTEPFLTNFVKNSIQKKFTRVFLFHLTISCSQFSVLSKSVDTFGT